MNEGEGGDSFADTSPDICHVPPLPPSLMPLPSVTFTFSHTHVRCLPVDTPSQPLPSAGNSSELVVLRNCAVENHLRHSSAGAGALGGQGRCAVAGQVTSAGVAHGLSSISAAKPAAGSSLPAREPAKLGQAYAPITQLEEASSLQ